MLGSSDGTFPHQPGGGIAHGRIFGLHVFLIIIDSPIDLVIFLTPQLLLDLLAPFKDGLCIALLLSVQFVDSGRPHILGPHGFCRTGRLVDHAETLLFILVLATQAAVVRFLFTATTRLLDHRIVGRLLLLRSDHGAAFVAAAATVPGPRITERALSAARRPFPPRLFEEEGAHLAGRIPRRKLFCHLRSPRSETGAAYRTALRPHSSWSLLRKVKAGHL
ncbi:hypothetical protein LEMLEM_LOCUS17532 [Lemmus lemmus]